MGQLGQPLQLALALFLRQHTSAVKSTDSRVCLHRIQPGSTTSCVSWASHQLLLLLCPPLQNKDKDKASRYGCCENQMS